MGTIQYDLLSLWVHFEMLCLKASSKVVIIKMKRHKGAAQTAAVHRHSCVRCMEEPAVKPFITATL